MPRSRALLSRARIIRLGYAVSLLFTIILSVPGVQFIRAYLDASTNINRASRLVEEIRAAGTLLNEADQASSVQAALLARNQAGSLVQQMGPQMAHRTRNQWALDTLQGLIRSLGKQNSTSEALTLQSATEILDQLQEEESSTLALNSRAQTRAIRNLANVVAILCALLLFTGSLTALAGWRLLREQGQVEDTLRSQKDELANHVNRLELISAASELIQRARNEKHMAQAATDALPRILPETRGSVSLLDSSGALELQARWGGIHSTDCFSREECIALRTDRIVHRTNSVLQLSCPRAARCSNAKDYVCIPVRTSSQQLGVIHIAADHLIEEREVEPASFLAANLGLGIYNRRRIDRDTLRQDLREICPEPLRINTPSIG